MSDFYKLGSQSNISIATSYRNKSLLTKTGLTTVITEVNLTRLFEANKSYGNIIVEFKTDKEGVRLANKYRRLANNPSIEMNVTFKKIE